MADKADGIVSKTGPDCQAEQVTRSTFTRHVCERDTAVFRTCERRAEIGGHEATCYEDRNAHIDRTAIRWWRDGARVRGTFPAPFTGKLTAGRCIWRCRMHCMPTAGRPPLPCWGRRPAMGKATGGVVTWAWAELP